MASVISTSLFAEDPSDLHHRAYGSLRDSPSRKELRDWCDETYHRHQGQFDSDFAACFRRDLPQRFSELFFASAFASAGWEAADRAVGFDLVYKCGDRRLLVEVTTPAAPPKDCWTEEIRDGQTVYSGDGRTVEESLLRLTTGLAKKASLIRRVVAADATLATDYKVVALSGFLISQETPFPLSESGQVPDFARALLPIGDRFARIPVGPGSDAREVEWGYQPSATIEKRTGVGVARTSFLDGLVPDVNAVAYSSVNLFGLNRPHWQVGILHNPTSDWKEEPLDLGMGNEYFVTIADETFELRRRKLPELDD